MQAAQPNSISPRVIHRGVESYQLTFDAMRAFTDARDAQTPDEFWIVEHPPVFTLGLGADQSHVLAHDIGCADRSRRRSHFMAGPGCDLSDDGSATQPPKARLFARICAQDRTAVIDTLAAYNLAGERKAGAPGIYVSDGQYKGAKIAALGLKVRGNGCTYHGVSLNVAMDLTPFSWINPCGYAGLATVDMKTLGVSVPLADVQATLAQHLQHL
jgi:lipoyl(octanoyl) transferase